MAEDRKPSPAEEVGRLYEETETRTARAFEQLVARDSFGELLARVTENVVGLTKIGTGVLDLMLRNLRLAGRQDVTRLARQLARTEDKLELVLQEVERLSERVGPSEREPQSAGASRRAPRASSANGGDTGSARRGTRSGGARS
jgi:hypothetical protein